MVNKDMQIYTKELLIEKLKKITEMGWVKCGRKGNYGGVGNTLEDLLGIKENNLPIPNAAEWELKCQRLKTNSLITLFHVEPSPTALRFVQQILVPYYGWMHKEAGKRYPADEKSFRQTISCREYSDRGFKVIVDREQEKILISFDKNCVHERHSEWLEKILDRTKNSDLDPQPYWGFKDLYHKAGTKLHNCFFVLADSKIDKGIELFKYQKIWMLSDFSLNGLIQAIEVGDILVDFDARTGHNHGTKFRFRNGQLPKLYENILEIK